MSNQRLWRCARASIGAVILSQPMLAQSPDTQAVGAPRFCWHSRPMPHCAAFAITEVAFTTPLTTTRTDRDPQYGHGAYPDFRTGISWTIGIMRNEGRARAQGVSVSVRVDGEALAPSVEWRNRQWIPRSRSYVDFSAGYTQKEVFLRPPGVGQRIKAVNAHGITASGIVAPIDLIGLVARGDAVFTPGKGHYGASVGAQTGSYGGAIVTGVMGLLAVVLIIGLSNAEF